MRPLFPLLLLLQGCGYETSYPDLEPHEIGNLGVVDTDVPQDIPCSRSDAGVISSVEVVNLRLETMELATVDPETCEEVAVDGILELTTLEFTSGSHLTWTVRAADGQLVDVFQLPEGISVEWTHIIR